MLYERYYDLFPLECYIDSDCKDPMRPNCVQNKCISKRTVLSKCQIQNISS